MNIEMRKNLYAMKRDDRKIQNRVFKARPRPRATARMWALIRRRR